MHVTITGTLVWYFAICPRQAWLMMHQIEPERENVYLAEGRLNQEIHYSGSVKELPLPGMRIDRIRKEQGVFIVSEVKKTSRFLFAARLQVGYYLMRLAREGFHAQGEILVPDERFRENVVLDEQLKRDVESVIEEIRKLEGESIPPKAKWIKYCYKCAYAEFCWSGDEIV